MSPRLNPHLAALHPYVPGEQINRPEVVKLNTNECPFDPPPGVLEAIREVTSNAARKYPEPSCRALREAIAADYSIAPEAVVVGNGSDEILRLIFHAYAPAGEPVAVLDPTYSLYPVLGQMFGAPMQVHATTRRGPLPESFITSAAGIKFLPNPNPPIGNQYTKAEVERLLDHSELVIFDEAYVAFAKWSAAEFLATRSNLIITRSFSKSHSLAGMRVGFAMGPVELISRLAGIRDSYSVNAVSQAAALAAWRDREWLAGTAARIRHLRGFLTLQLRQLGFEVTDSAGNFVFAEHPQARTLLQYLREHDILVRHFALPGLENGLRITIGTELEVERLLKSVRNWLHMH